MKALLLALSLLAPIDSLDWAVQREVQAARRPVFEAPMRLSTAVGKPLILVGTFAAIAFLDPSRGPRTVIVTALALVPTNLVVEGLKRLTFRTRPDGERKRSNASFPSSHAANALAVAAVLGRRWRRAAPAFYAGAIAVAFSRMYLNRHFLSDVVAGAAIGLAFAWLAERWMARREARNASIHEPSGG